jgi:hypothetical protein
LGDLRTGAARGVGGEEEVGGGMVMVREADMGCSDGLLLPFFFLFDPVSMLVLLLLFMYFSVMREEYR